MKATGEKIVNKVFSRRIIFTPNISNLVYRVIFFRKHNPNNEQCQFWQQGNHQIELWSKPVIDQKLDYIHNNPVVAGWVDLPEYYLYSSARDYADIKGLLDIDLLLL